MALLTLLIGAGPRPPCTVLSSSTSENVDVLSGRGSSSAHGANVGGGRGQSSLWHCRFAELTSLVGWDPGRLCTSSLDDDLLACNGKHRLDRNALLWLTVFTEIVHRAFAARASEPAAVDITTPTFVGFRRLELIHLYLPFVSHLSPFANASATRRRLSRCWVVGVWSRPTTQG